MTKYDKIIKDYGGNLNNSPTTPCSCSSGENMTRLIAVHKLVWPMLMQHRHVWKLKYNILLITVD